MEAFCDASIGAVLYDMVLAEDKARGLDRPQPKGWGPDLLPAQPKGWGSGEGTRDYSQDDAAATVPPPAPAVVAPADVGPADVAAQQAWAASQQAWATASATAGGPAAVAPVDGVHSGDGKGFGGGEATRDPDATAIDPSDPKAKQQAIQLS